jgi:hypothetical protein
MASIVLSTQQSAKWMANATVVYDGGDARQGEKVKWSTHDEA